ncbi:MAG: M20/M25/M40 family metallo-hydrolase [bacterium]|nr:M20/M25/M40 family metallo-hydrolase [bacterium]
MPDGATIVNVVAVLQGTGDPAKTRRYYVVGHYDTINGDRMDPKADAPGANDDASGTAVVLECARVLAAHPLEATVVFLCTAAEEQGLVGAKLHAEAAAKRGDLIAGVLNNDIVGDPSVQYFDMEKGWVDARHHVRLFSEGLPRNASAQELAEIRQLGKESDSPSRQLARFVFDVARLESLPVQPVPIFRFDRFLRGGDHTAFNEAGFAAVRFTVPAEDYSRQHQDVTERDGKPYGDVASFVDAGYVADVARLNTAVLFHLANAPAAPSRVRMVTKQLETGTTLRWAANTEPDVGGYEVVWRRTTTPGWEGSFDAKSATEWVSEASKDNYFFGVRAYDVSGLRGPVTFAGSAPE